MNLCVYSMSGVSVPSPVDGKAFKRLVPEGTDVLSGQGILTVKEGTTGYEV